MPRMLLLALAMIAAASAALAQPPEKRCGWFENPTPANAWLTDRDGQWIISTQGGPQAEGDWPEFADDEWVKTNVHYGYGCACMRVIADKAEKRIIKIRDAQARPLSACQSDASLPRPAR